MARGGFLVAGDLAFDPDLGQGDLEGRLDDLGDLRDRVDMVLDDQSSVFVTILRQDLPRDRQGLAGPGVDLDENTRQEQAVARRLEPLGPRGQEPLDGLLAGDPDDRVAAARHARVGDVGRAAGQDPLVRRRDVGVRADDGRDAAVQVPAEGLLLRGRLGVGNR